MTIDEGHHYHENHDEEDLVAALKRASQVPDPFAIRVESEINDIVFTVFEDGLAQMGIVQKDWYIGSQDTQYQMWTFIPIEVIEKLKAALDRVTPHVR